MPKYVLLLKTKIILFNAFGRALLQTSISTVVNTFLTFGHKWGYFVDQNNPPPSRMFTASYTVAQLSGAQYSMEGCGEGESYFPFFKLAKR